MKNFKKIVFAASVSLAMTGPVSFGPIKTTPFFLNQHTHDAVRRASDFDAPQRIIAPLEAEFYRFLPTRRIGGSIFSSATNEQRLPVVRLVYLVPSDKVVNGNYQSAIERAIKNLQIWYRAQMNNVLTFRLNQPVVQVLTTPHASSWYANHATSDESEYWFWENVLSDGFMLTGGKFNDSQNRWVYYIDADPACGQIQGAGTNGVSELPANDLRGLTGAERVRICPSDLIDTTPVCRWVGGLGHELGHAFGLSHPSSCENHEPSCPSDTLMWLGYLNYPDTYLLPENKNYLKHSPFFSPSFASQDLPACGM